MLIKPTTVANVDCQFSSLVFRTHGHRQQLTTNNVKLTLQDAFSVESLRVSAKEVIINRGCAGADGFTVDDLETWIKSTENLKKLSAMNLTGKYFPKRLMETYIPKDNGGQRKLNIPCVHDRLVQKASTVYLNETIDLSFHDRSFGYRPRRSLYDAVDLAKRLAVEYPFVIKLDFKNFFDNINQRRLGVLLNSFNVDPLLRKLIKRFITTKIFYNGKLINKTDSLGIPQGGALSPFLANLYLDRLDWVLSENGLEHVRYADDVMIFAKSKEHGEHVKMSTASFCNEILLAPLNEDKCSVVDTQNLKFLGLILNNGLSIAPLAKVEGKLIEFLTQLRRKPEFLFDPNSRIKPLSKLKNKVSEIISCYKRADNFNEVLKLTDIYQEKYLDLINNHKSTIQLWKLESRNSIDFKKYERLDDLQHDALDFFQSENYAWLYDSKEIYNKHGVK